MLQDAWLWLATPLSGVTEHAVKDAIAWHGRAMVFAWGLLVPVAVVMARFFKVTPKQNWPSELDNKCWWRVHRLVNVMAVGLTAAAVWLVWPGDAGPVVRGTVRDWHGWMGWTVVVLAGLQVLGGVFRGSKGGPTAPRLAPDGSVKDLHGDHFDMTRRRVLFERIHKSMGYAALVGAWATLALGLWIADAPRWMCLAMSVWWTALVCWAGILQSQGRCIDTYQAIWGTDPTLPGAKVRPVGWGVRSVSRGAVIGETATGPGVTTTCRR